MRVVVVGGSSQSTPALIQSLMASGSLPSLDISLIGRNPTTLNAVTRASQLIAANAINIQPAYLVNDDYRDYFVDADIILIQIRVGGYSKRVDDETFPHLFDQVGDEGIGLGGVASAWRTWPMLDRILAQLSKQAPSAQIILLTSPMNILLYATHTNYPALKIMGVCELPWATLIQICDSLSVPVDQVEYDYVGVNHLGWFYSIRHEAENLIEKYARSLSKNNPFPSPELIQEYGAIPLKYLRMHFQADHMLSEQRQRKNSRGHILQKLSDQAFQSFALGTLEQVQATLQTRLAPWYPEAVVPLILGFAGQPQSTHVFLSMVGDDQSHATIYENPYRFQEKRLIRVPRKTPVPVMLMNFLNPFVHFQKNLATAILHQSKPMLITALQQHPWFHGQDAPSIANHVMGQAQ